MNRYKKHIFVCENVRDKNHSTPSCGRSGGKENREKLKQRLRELGLTLSIRANSSGCLGMCHHAPVAVIYPEGRWLGEIDVNDINQIVEDCLINNKSIERLEINDG